MWQVTKWMKSVSEVLFPLNKTLRKVLCCDLFSPLYLWWENDEDGALIPQSQGLSIQLTWQGFHCLQFPCKLHIQFVNPQPWASFVTQTAFVSSLWELSPAIQGRMKQNIKSGYEENRNNFKQESFSNLDCVKYA